MAYAVFESTNMKSTNGSLPIYDVVANTDIENGTVGYIELTEKKDGVIYTFHKGVKAGAVTVIADQPAWTEDTSYLVNQRKDKFIIEKGVPFRGRAIGVGCKFAISGDAVTPETVDKMKQDAYVTVNSDGKFVASETKTDSAVVECYVESSRVTGGQIVTKANTYGYSRVMYKLVVTTV